MSYSVASPPVANEMHGMMWLAITCDTRQCAGTSEMHACLVGLDDDESDARGGDGELDVEVLDDGVGWA